jgi:hypothetical protein
MTRPMTEPRLTVMHPAFNRNTTFVSQAERRHGGRRGGRAPLPLVLAKLAVVVQDRPSAGLVTALSSTPACN